MAIKRGYVPNHKVFLETHKIEALESPPLIEITLGCPDCLYEFSYTGRYYENIEETIQCPNCGFKSSKWTFNYVEGSND